MLHKIRGVVLRSTRYSESSVIVLFYTDLFGMQSYIINGVRKQKATITNGMLQPLTLVDAEVYHKTQGDIQRLRELRVNPVLPGLSRPENAVLALFAAELLIRSIKEEAGDVELFDYLSHHIQLFALHPMPLQALIRFMLGLSARLGFQPTPRELPGQWLNLSEGRFEKQRDARSFYARPDSAEQLALLLEGGGNDQVLGSNCLKDLLLLYQCHIPNFKLPQSTSLLIDLMGE